MPQDALYFVHWNDSPDIAPFNHYLREVGALKFMEIKPHSLDMHYNEGIEINFVISGTYKWKVEDKYYQLYPGEAFITCPWQWHGSPAEILDRGILSWMILQPKSYTPDGKLDMGDWSRLSTETQQKIGCLLAENHNPIIPRGSNLINTFRKLNTELTNKEIGYEERINLLLDSMIIKIARALQKRKSVEERDDAFIHKLTDKMKDCFIQKLSMTDLAFQFGMSPTSFNNKVKVLTGFSPTDYLIELKMEHAKQQLAEAKISITDISANCGFYSSQHFATQFAKRVGTTPSNYRKLNRKPL